MTKRIILVLIIVAMATGITINADETRKREMRATWVATVYGIDWPQTQNNASAQKAEFNAYLDNLQTQNFNAIFFQVRTMCDAFYQSSYEPWSSYLTGTRGRDPGYDPLQYAVEQCHARGIQCHAWVNPYRWSTGTDWNTPQDQALKNAGMLLSYNDGSSTYTILNPGLPETRERIVNVIREIISNYDVDGVVFDDYFYPNGIPTNNKAGDYNLWNNSNVDMTFADWRRNNVNMMVRDVYNMIQDVKPEVRFGISPAGVAGTASTSASQHGVTPCPKGSDWQYNGIFSDPLAWLEQGTIDYISPQIYWKTDHYSNPFGPITDWWSYIAKHYGRHHYASHSISFFDSSNTASDWAEVVQQINLSRQYTEDNAPGAVLYSTRYINGPRKTGLGAYLLANAFQRPAMIPAVTWKTAPGYGAPAHLALNDGTLSWTAQQGTLVKYSVYAVPDGMTEEEALSPAYGGIRSDYLLGVTYSPDYKLPDAFLSGYRYAVCVVDGYGNESEPAYIGADGGQDPGQPTEVTYSIEKVWEINNLSFLNTANARQGFGMDGKFYINDKGTRTILVVDQNGLTGTTYEGGSNVGLTRDEAGNLLVSNAPFSVPWGNSAEVKVINPATGAAVTHALPVGVTDFGRCDLLGFARGNLLEDGEFFIVGANSGSSISRITITDGALDTDNTYLANCNGVSATSGTMLNAYTDANGDDAVLHVNRSSGTITKMMPDGDNFIGTAVSLPGKGNCNGAFPFVWNGVDYIIYPTLNNYRDGFAVSQPNAAEPLVSVPQTASADANTYQANWVNAEVIDDRNVTIYQYYPGGHLTVWRLTKRGGILRGDANDDGKVTISDVTILISGLMTNSTNGINADNADSDLNGRLSISDVTTIISFLLNGSWPE